MTYTQDNGLIELIKKIEILNHPQRKKRYKEMQQRHQIIRKMIDILEIPFVINIKNMDILKNNVIDIIKLLNKSVNQNLKQI